VTRPPGAIGAAVAALVAGTVACSGRARVDSCDDELAGVWRDQQGRGYHVVDAADHGYEVFALFDSARPPGGDKGGDPVIYAPWVWDLTRRPSGLSGTRSQRMTRDGVSCVARTAIEVKACAGGRLTVRVQDVAAMAFPGCAATPGDWIELVLEPE